tara:strand:+ start:8828 stop:9382 length:555 start_codon:yes stop_codon:yes gene_type:complete
MDKRIIIVLSLLLVVFAYGCTRGGDHDIGTTNVQGQAVAGNVGINQGNIAPDFTVKTIDGKTLSLSQLTNDKPTVLYFFATWCPNCARDLGAVKDIYPQYSDKVNFLAIDVDQRESEAQIASYKQRMNLPNVDFAAAKRDVLADYNVVYTTTKYFIGKDGTILNKGVGGIDQNTWHQVFQSMFQ